MKLWGEEASTSAKTGNRSYDWVKKPFLWLCLLYTFALLALLRADYSYVDDMGRALWGYRGWLDWSRYMTMGLSFLVHSSIHLTDISPVPQLLAIGLMALSGLLVAYTLTGKKEISWPLLLAALPMGLSPWFLECFSYKFDAPYMAVSVLASVLPFLWWGKDEKKFYIVSFVSLLAMTTTYQASAGIFVIETLFLAFLSWMRGGNSKFIFLWMIRAALIYAVALLIFKIFLVRPPIEKYASVDAAPLAMLPTVVVGNATAYLGIVWQDLNLVSQIFVAAMAAFFVLHALRGTKKNRLLTLLASLVFLVITAVLSYGPYLVLEIPFLSPRGLLGIGIWFSFVAISLLSMTEGKGAAKWLVLLVAWQLMTGASAYGNALADQKRYTDFRVQLLVQDLDRLHLTENNDIQYHLLGDIGKSPLVRNVEQEYPAVKRLIVPTFAFDTTWTQFYFYFYHDLAMHTLNKEDPRLYKNLPEVFEGRYHKIQSDGKDVLISLKTSDYENMRVVETGGKPYWQVK